MKETTNLTERRPPGGSLSMRTAPRANVFNPSRMWAEPLNEAGRKVESDGATPGSPPPRSVLVTVRRIVSANSG